MCRLYTGPKDWSTYTILSSTQAYEKIMKNNVDSELSPNSIENSIQKALNTSKSAIFIGSKFFYWFRNLKHPQPLSCLVRIK